MSNTRCRLHHASERQRLQPSPLLSSACHISNESCPPVPSWSRHDVGAPFFATLSRGVGLASRVSEQLSAAPPALQPLFPSVTERQNRAARKYIECWCVLGVRHQAASAIQSRYTSKMHRLFCIPVLVGASPTLLADTSRVWFSFVKALAAPPPTRNNLYSKSCKSYGK